MTIANEILNQLGGNRFIAMTGAKNFLDCGNGLSFRLPSNFAKSGINYVKVSLNASDLYDVTFGKIRGTSYKILNEVDGIYADMLQSIFTDETGLDTHL